jgi:hypothetical protein
MRIQCTACQSILNSTGTVPIGSSVRCPRCGQTFRVTAEAPAETVRPPVKQAEPKPASAGAAPDAIPVAELIEEEAVPAAELDEDEAEPAASRVVKKKRGSSAGLWIAVAGILFALVFGGAAVVYYGFSKGRVALALAGGDALTGWEPDPVLVGYLDQEIKLTPLDNLHIKVSKKAPIQAREQRGGRLWRITQLGSDLDGEGTNLNVFIQEKPAGLENNPFAMLGSLQLPQSSNLQSGTINGMPFTRVRIDGQYNAKGFAYFGVVDKYIVVLSSLESEKTLPRLKLAESAVLTLHKD